VAPVRTPSLPSLLRERASLQPDDTALTFIDYEQDWAGVAESLTWSQLYRRALNVALELTRCGSAGDRAAILAPQGLEYIAAFLGSVQAGFIAVPLPVPQIGAHDERVSAVLDDATPTVILTTSAVVGSVTEYAAPRNGNAAPSIIEVDLLDLDSRKGPGARAEDSGGVAYLQYTSGSTRVPAGVMITHANLQVNFEQLMSDYFVDFSGAAPPDTTIVSWLPFYHDITITFGVRAACGNPRPGRRPRCMSRPRPPVPASSQRSVRLGLATPRASRTARLAGAPRTRARWTTREVRPRVGALAAGSCSGVVGRHIRRG
jgi:acyl-CoA synthetase (AMP-forming)/AMP-acid ligase II